MRLTFDLKQASTAYVLNVYSGNSGHASGSGRMPTLDPLWAHYSSSYVLEHPCWPIPENYAYSGNVKYSKFFSSLKFHTLQSNNEKLHSSPRSFDIHCQPCGHFSDSGSKSLRVKSSQKHSLSPGWLERSAHQPKLNIKKNIYIEKGNNHKN